MTEYVVTSKRYETAQLFEDQTFIYLEDGNVHYWTPERDYLLGIEGKFDIIQPDWQDKTKRTKYVKSKRFIYGDTFKFELATGSYKEGRYFQSRILEWKDKTFRLGYPLDPRDQSKGVVYDEDDIKINSGVNHWPTREYRIVDHPDLIILMSVYWSRFTPKPNYQDQYEGGYYGASIMIISPKDFRCLLNSGARRPFTEEEKEDCGWHKMTKEGKLSFDIGRDKLWKMYGPQCRLVDNRILINGTVIEVKPAPVKEKKECSICFKKPKPTGVIAPCLHKEFCYDCVKDIKECPMCRGTVSAVVKV
jgi:Zinc finger, C3HC4 type (RING finger)